MQRIIYAVVYAAIRAYLDAVRDSALYEREEPTADDRARAARFRSAVRVHAANQGSAQHDYPASNCRACDADDICACGQRQFDDEAENTGARGLVGRQSICGGG